MGLLRERALLVKVTNDKVDAGQTNAAVVEDAAPEGVVKVGHPHARAHLHEKVVGALEDVRAFLVAGQDADEEAIEGRLQAVRKRKEAFLVQVKDGRTDVDGGVGEQREEAIRVDGQLGEKAFLTDGLKDGIVRFEGLQVDTRGK